jgi:hypothetical protein
LLDRLEVALTTSSRVPASTFTQEELARLRKVRRVFLRQRSITPHDG